MKQIHHVVTTYENRYVLDPARGPVQRREPVFAPSTTDRIVHDGETYEVQPDGSFVVPEHVADHMTRMPDWYEGPSPFQPEAVEEKPRARAPRKPSA